MVGSSPNPSVGETMRGGRFWPGKNIWLLPIGSLLMQSAIFQGMNLSSDFSFDGWLLTLVCLVPWLMYIVRIGRHRTVYVYSYAIGIGFFAINMFSIRNLTWPGYLALCIYFGFYYGLFGLIVRTFALASHWSLSCIVPIAWVASELLRGLGPLAFPFLHLSHGVFRRLELIQIADVVGAYGVSFVLAAVNGWVADVMLFFLSRPAWSRRWSVLIGPTVWVVALGVGTITYGWYRLTQQTISVGPMVAVLQGDYPSSVELQQSSASPVEKRDRYLELMQQAAEHRPELILMPETPWEMSLNEDYLHAETTDSQYQKYLFFQEWSRACDTVLRQSASAYQSHIVTGASSIEFFPTAVYPKYKKYNSVFFYDYLNGGKHRYDKVRLVLFGEYTPFRYGRWHSLYRWLDRFNPFSLPDDEFSLTPGENFRTFSMLDRTGRSFRFGVPICFEDLIPKVSRAFVFGDQKNVDFLLSVSNDGWFNHGAIVPQHLAVCVFRAVENRVGIARSVNTSCSGFIQPTGKIDRLVNEQGRVLGPGIFGYQASNIMIDSRYTLYTQWGDWFGWLCFILSVILFIVVCFRNFTTGRAMLLDEI